MLTTSYRQLPEMLWRRVSLSPVPDPSLFALNEMLAGHMGLDATWLASSEGIAMLAGCRMPPGVMPVAQAYAGHQFGQFVPSLGDGRAMMLGSAPDAKGRINDIQLKGAGRTPFSRSGDGRAAIGPVLREYLLSEAMHALGVKTTRALAAVSTGEDVLRDRALPGAILTRVSRSFLRVGSFQYAACRGDLAAIRALVFIATERLYPGVTGPRSVMAASEVEAMRVPLFNAVVEAQADLVAHWMSLGFVHGVMNTDNMSIAGETIDYGPCAFLDHYIPDKVYSGIDVRKRYAFQLQPDIARWNLARFAETLLLSEDDDVITPLREVIDDFPARYRRRYRHLMSRKLGLTLLDAEDNAIIDECLGLLAAEAMDYTTFFLTLPEMLSGDPNAHAMGKIRAFDTWFKRWTSRVAQNPGGRSNALAVMSQHNPAVIPRNHQVEKVISAAEAGDLTPFRQFHDAITHPYRRCAVYERPPRAEEEVHVTWCGT